MRISDWSSDVCSSDLGDLRYGLPAVSQCRRDRVDGKLDALTYTRVIFSAAMALQQFDLKKIQRLYIRQTKTERTIERRIPFQKPRSEEPTSELQSIMRISYTVFCLEKIKTQNN